MIASKLVTPDMIVSECSITGYGSIQEAAKALLNDWPVMTFIASNVAVLADCDGCRLILQEKK